MHRIDTPTAQADKFGPGKNGFTGGNPQTGQLPTALDEDFFDSVQEEIARVVEGAGLSLDKSEKGQLFEALGSLFLKTENNLSEIKAAGAEAVQEVLKNLGLGEAAKLNTGTEEGNLPKIGESHVVVNFGSNANGQWRIWSNGTYEMWGTVASINATTGVSSIIYPLTLPEISRNITITQLTQVVATRISATIVADTTVTANGFSATTLFASDNRALTSAYMWRVIYQP